MTMDCRTFHKNLEDYLQDDLDFAGRFGMERHAQQCFDCGKELADAQKLRRLIGELVRVKAPVNFESRVCAEAARRRAHGLRFRIRNYWSYSFEWPSWRKLALATSTLAVLGFGIFYAMHRETLRQAPGLVVLEPQPMPKPAKMQPVNAPEAPVAQASTVARVHRQAKALPVPQLEDQELFQDEELPRAEAVDYLLVGPDNHPAPEKMPQKIYVRYGPPSEDYFIRNVSH